MYSKTSNDINNLNASATNLMIYQNSKDNNDCTLNTTILDRTSTSTINT